MNISAHEEALTILEACKDTLDNLGLFVIAHPDEVSESEERELIEEAYNDMLDLIRTRLELWTAQVKNGAEIKDNNREKEN